MTSSTTSSPQELPWAGSTLVRRLKRNHRIGCGAVVCVLAWLLTLGSVVPGRAAGSLPAPGPYGYFDFSTCVRYALVHSELFLKNRLEIQIKSADLKDSHSELLPTIQLVTRYYLARAGENSAENPLSVTIAMINWNPYLALLKIKASGIMVDIAQTSHFEKMAAGVAEMAKIFYRIDLLKSRIRASKQLLALRRDKLEYAQSRSDQGEEDPVAVKSLAIGVKGEQLAVKGLEQELEAFTQQLKILMGYHPDYYLPLDTRDAVNQVLDGFNGQLMTFADIQGANLKLKITSKYEQLQANRVTAAYLALVPQPLIVAEGISNQVDRTSGFNFALGLDYTLWDGFRRVRDIKRQKLLARQLNLDRHKLSRELYNQYRNLTRTLDVSGDKEGFQRERTKVAELSEERTLLRYKAGETTFPDYLESRISKAQAHLDSIKAQEERVVGLIDLATLAGGLNRYNARIRF